MQRSGSCCLESRPIRETPGCRAGWSASPGSSWCFCGDNVPCVPQGPCGEAASPAPTGVEFGSHMEAPLQQLPVYVEDQPQGKSTHSLFSLFLPSYLFSPRSHDCTGDVEKLRTERGPNALAGHLPVAVGTRQIHILEVFPKGTERSGGGNCGPWSEPTLRASWRVASGNAAPEHQSRAAFWRPGTRCPGPRLRDGGGEKPKSFWIRG